MAIEQKTEHERDDLLKIIGINPAHASCLLVLAIADIISLTSYFSLGTYMLK